MPPRRDERPTRSKDQGSEIHADRAKQRRAAYAQDPAGAGRIRDGARERYQAANPKQNRPAGLLSRGENREIDGPDFEHPVQCESFTIPQAAEALGRSVATLRRWIEANKLPPPLYWETTRRVGVYSVGELQVIRQLLVEHEQEYTYLVDRYSDAVERVHQAVHAYRAEFF